MCVQGRWGREEGSARQGGRCLFPCREPPSPVPGLPPKRAKGSEQPSLLLQAAGSAPACSFSAAFRRLSPRVERKLGSGRWWGGTHGLPDGLSLSSQ